MKYRIVFSPWLTVSPYVLQKRDEYTSEWEFCSQSFADLKEADRFIENVGKGEQVVREFEL